MENIIAVGMTSDLWRMLSSLVERSGGSTVEEIP
jgi:hypothetical protein